MYGKALAFSPVMYQRFFLYFEENNLDPVMSHNEVSYDFQFIHVSMFAQIQIKLNFVLSWNISFKHICVWGQILTVSPPILDDRIGRNPFGFVSSCVCISSHAI